MKDFLKQILQDIENPLLARCVIREYLQARLLQSLQGKGVFSAWVFQGGTALRFLYAMPRFSEDLDFALVKPGLSDNFREVLKNVKDVFQSENYDITVKVSDAKTVKSAFIRYAGLLFELGVSPHRSEVISVKVELDTNSPLGAGITSTVVRRYVTLNLRHYDKASLLAGKLHAVLTRRYVKGRDIYDLIWYLSDASWPDPNIELLNNALGQTN
jgi:predicted nucleotidyltransferase component of viral defense system